MTVGDWHLLIPGPLEQRTGGYLYDAQIVRELTQAGMKIAVHSLPGRFPLLDDTARKALADCLNGLPEQALVVADGLAVGAQPEIVAGAAKRLRLVVLLHHLLADETGLSEAEQSDLRAREQAVLAASRGVIVTSPYTARRLATLGQPPDKLWVVVPGLVQPDQQAAVASRSQRVLADPSTNNHSAVPVPVVLCVGSIVPRKGQHLLLQALSGLRELPWHCRLVGSLERDPEYAEGLQAWVRAQDLQSRVEWVGEIDGDTLAAAYATADLFVLPSYFEGYGMVLSEAQSWGLPVVTTTGGACAETVPEATAVRVPPGDVAALQAALQLLLQDAGWRQQLGAAGRAYALTLPDWHQQAQIFARALNELAGA